MHTHPRSPTLPRWLWALPGLAAAVILAGGYAFWQTETQHLQAQTQDSLTAIAKLKAQQIADWRTERLSDAMAFTDAPAFAAEAALWMSTGRADLRTDIIVRLTALEFDHQYRDATLLDLIGQPRLSLSGLLVVPDGAGQEAIARAIASGQPAFRDLYREAPGNSPEMDVLAPLVTPSGQPAGLILLSIDPQKYLYPLLQNWPVPSVSAESLLVRRDGNDAVWISNLRYQPDAAVSLRMRLTATTVPAVMAVLGRQGAVRGADYRGVDVLSALEPVPDSPWYLVAKEDTAEALGFVRVVAGLLGVSLAGLLAVVAVTAGLAWQQILKRHYRDLAAAETQRLALARHFEYLVKYANDVIILADAGRHVAEVNDRALETYGYTREEMLKLHLSDLRVPEEAALVRQRQRELEADKSVRYETRHRRRDGTMFPVEISVREIVIEGRPFFQGIVRDISERVRAEQLIGEQTEQLQAQHEELAAQHEELQAQHDELVAQQEELREVERTLRESEFFFRESQRAASVGSYKADFVRGSWEASEVLDRILGIDRHYIRSMPGWLDLIHPDDRDVMNRYLTEEARGQRRPFNREFRIVRRDDGETRWVLGLGTVEVDAEGQATALRGTVQDITERKRAEEALRESEERFRRTFDEGPIGAALSGPDFRFTRVNAALCRMLGYTEAELRRLSFADITHPDHLAQDRDQVGRVQRGEVDVYSTEKRYLRKDGGVVWGRLTLRRITDPGGAFLHFLPMIEDITERKAAEALVQAQQDRMAAQNEKLAAQNEELLTQARALAQAEASLQQVNRELERRIEARSAELRTANAELKAANAALLRANRLKDEFLANMSHELRTPLTGILGLVEVIDKGIYGEVTESQRRALEMVHTSGEHLLQLINDILDLSKVEAGKMELQLDPVVVDDACRASLEFIVETAHKKNISTTYRLDSRVKWIRADTRRLKQMLVNLLSNAVKFTPEGGRVGLEVEGDPAAREVRFTVWDTGIGVPPDQQQYLFQPFVQLDGSLARQYEGTGLGLALVSSLAKMHGGGVAVHSAGRGQGSRFTFTLPWSAETPAEVQAEVSSQPLSLRRVQSLAEKCGRPPRILAVDDSATSLMVVTDFLEAAGCRVLTASSGAQGLELAFAERPDLMLLDIQMPDMDGLAVLRELRARWEGPRLPVIVLTALAMSGDRERHLAAGADDYLSKPMNLHEMAAAIARQLETLRD
jgi:two-component system sensor histidine kinase/response regulator